MNKSCFVRKQTEEEGKVRQLRKEDYRSKVITLRLTSSCTICNSNIYMYYTYSNIVQNVMAG